VSPSVADKGRRKPSPCTCVAQAHVHYPLLFGFLSRISRQKQQLVGFVLFLHPILRMSLDVDLTAPGTKLKRLPLASRKNKPFKPGAVARRKDGSLALALFTNPGNKLRWVSIGPDFSPKPSRGISIVGSGRTVPRFRVPSRPPPRPPARPRSRLPPVPQPPVPDPTRPGRRPTGAIPRTGVDEVPSLLFRGRRRVEVPPSFQPSQFELDQSQMAVLQEERRRRNELVREAQGRRDPARQPSLEQASQQARQTRSRRGVISTALRLVGMFKDMARFAEGTASELPPGASDHRNIKRLHCF